MSCEGYRDRLIDALAGGEGSLGGDMAAHLRECAECKKFYEAQVHLFGAIDSDVRAMVNVAVPASLLPGACARIEKTRMAWAWVPWVVPAAGVAMVALLILIPVVWHVLGPHQSREAISFERQDLASEPHPVIANVSENMNEPLVKKHPVSPRSLGPIAARPLPQTTGVQVLVDPEEARGLLRLTTVVRDSPQWAVAMLRPAELTPGHPDDIQPVQVSELEVKALSEEDR
jgi:hypothetical protein